MQAFRKTISMILAAILLLGTLPAMAEGEVVVKNYKELLAAMNDQKAERILISAKYKHGTKDITNLRPDGRVVTIAAENGEETVIDGRVDIYGPGTVIFENVIIKASQGAVGLWVGEESAVTIDKVYGGDSKNGSGGCAVIVTNAELTIGTAVGGSSNAGMGGDGIWAYGGAKVEVRETTGGSCADGVGGAGVIAITGAKVTVTGTATGGNGAVSAGKAVLAGKDGSIEVQGTQKDGEKLESKKAPDPEKIINYALLENALRNGKTEIVIDASYKSGMKAYDDLPSFVYGDEPVRITGSGKNGKAIRITEGFYLSGGSWEFSGIDIAAKGGNALALTDGAYASFTGNISSSKRATLYLDKQSRVGFTGNIDCTGSNSSTCVVRGDSTADITGNISVKNGNDIYLYDGTVTIRGNLTAQGYPPIYAIEGRVEMEGNIKTAGTAVCVVGEAVVTVKGNVTAKSKKHYALYTKAGEINIEGNVDSPYPCGGEGGKITINGERKFP